MYMKRLLLISFILSPVFSFFSTAQDLTGIWRGYFVDDNMNQYRYEVQMEQSKNNNLSGVTYSYLAKSFYGKSTMTGKFVQVSGNTLIQEIKTIEVRMEVGSQTCIQKCMLSYIKSGREEFLEGTFTSTFENTDTLTGILRGGNCGGGKMFLRKVITSDFYIEPFLRKKTAQKNDSGNLVKTTPVIVPPAKSNVSKSSTQKVNPPLAKNTTTNPDKTSSTKTKSNKNIVSTRPKTDSLKKAEVEVTPSNNGNNLTIKKEINRPPVLKLRENNLLQTLTVTSEEVIVKLYDNGEIDDDTISVYLDNSLVLSKQRLTAAALTIRLKMDETNPDHELTMVAENLGRIPPNTSLMIVTAGDKRFEVRITSTEQKNAVVRFRYVKQDKP